ncbi:MAG: hypothetical protein MRY78_10350 [Saprospiraceae bacterium]|nr:hypothetical protein [Saprospiraceae bacterium]
MLLIEKVIKLMDDFHFDIYREYVKNLSIRSYYPLALIDVIDRDFEQEQDSEKLFRAVYGDAPDGERDMKKFFQLAHHTFKLTSFLSRNYPDYLQHNLTRIQHLINSGELNKAIQLAEILKDVTEKVQDYYSEEKVCSLLAQKESRLESHKSAMKYYERIHELLGYQKAINDLNHFISQHLKVRGKEEAGKLEEHLSFLSAFHESESFIVRMISRLQTCYVYYNHRSPHFYTLEVFTELKEIEEELQKNDYVIFPFLHNIRPKLSFLKLNYSVRQLDIESVLDECSKIIEDSEDDLFWNSLINLPEFNAIGIQTSYYVTNYFNSYRENHMELMPEEVQVQIKFLRNRCQNILKNPLLKEKFVVRYINISSVYAGLLLLGDEESIKQSVDTLEQLLLFFQQVAFHSSIDSVYITLIMGYFCLKDYEGVERNYRRYKKSTKGKVVNPENDIPLHGFYYASKWLESGRSQYLKKLGRVVEETNNKSSQASTRKLLLDMVNYFKMEIPLEKEKK